MTLFDVIVLGVLALSALVGWVRGAIREVVTAGAFVAAALLSILALRFTRPIAEAAVDPDWAAAGVAVVATFLLAYIGLRTLGGALSRRVQGSVLSGADRSLGLGIGLLRGLLVIGVFYLVLDTVTPRNRMPGWVEDAAVHPLAAGTARVLARLAGETPGVAGRLGPAIRRAAENPADQQPQSDAGRSTPDEGAPDYDRSEREQLDVLVEESR